MKKKILKKKSINKKNIIVYLLATIIVILGITIYFKQINFWEIKFTDPLVNKVIHNNTGLKELLSQTTIDKYRKSIDEIKSINSEFRSKWCGISWDKITALAEDLRLLKEQKQAIRFLKKRLVCNNLSWETKFNILSSLAFISNDMWDRLMAINYYDKVIQEFSWNRFPFFGLSQEELMKQEIDNLKRK